MRVICLVSHFVCTSKSFKSIYNILTSEGSIDESFQFFRLYHSLPERFRMWRLRNSSSKRRIGKSPTATPKKQGVSSRSAGTKCQWIRFSCFTSYFSLSERDILSGWPFREGKESIHWEETTAGTLEDLWTLLVCRCHLHINSYGEQNPKLWHEFGGKCIHNFPPRHPVKWTVPCASTC